MDCAIDAKVKTENTTQSQIVFIAQLFVHFQKRFPIDAR
jgi:hypothetical protein